MYDSIKTIKKEIYIDEISISVPNENSIFIVVLRCIILSF